MKKRILFLITAVILCVFAGCSNENESSGTSSNAVADANEMAQPQEIDTSGMTPVYAADLKDGTYAVTVDSSSSMFKIDSCELTVKSGKMTALMTMSGKGYLYLFMGKGENADESGHIPFAENDNGAHTFTIPVEALDTEIECSAFSKAKEKWYDRTLLFRSDSLPIEAFNDSVLKTVQSLNIADGEYTIDVKLEGGSGRASVQTPTKLTVENGKAYAEIIWSSSNYNYMKVDGERFDPLNNDGNSAFVIPVTFFDRNITVSADTTAMSTPHEIEYMLYFDSGSIKS